MKPQPCPHADCRCPPSTAHAPYCSLYCANAAAGDSLPGEADPPGTCACGHAACREGKAIEREGPTVVTSTGHS